MINLKKQMIIIDGKIVTSKIAWFKYDETRSLYNVKFTSSNKFYNYSNQRFTLIENPINLGLDSYYIYLNGQLIKNIQEVYEFDFYPLRYFYIIYLNNYSASYTSKEIKLINKNNINTKIIDYLNEISSIVSLKNNVGNKLLSKQMKKVYLDDIDSVLANYLKVSFNILKSDSNILIFPFGCNSSQYKAVENAIHNKASVIEGPPGTGKTQTILNIIANLIIRNMTCQVVSNNNSAIMNIDEKLKKYDLDFFTALLGRRKNKDIFIKEQNANVPNFDNYKDLDMNEISSKLTNDIEIVRNVYEKEKTLANLYHEKNELETEYKYFKKLLKNQNVNIYNIKFYSQSLLIKALNELSYIDKLTIFKKIKFRFIYRIGNLKFYDNDLNTIIKNIKNMMYISLLDTLDKDISKKNEYINKYKNIEEEYIELSMDYFKKYLSTKYRDKRKIYSEKEIWKNSKLFLNDYPVVLSTTHSSRNSFNINTKFDYIIMDEASQIDVCTGVLAISSAKNAVVIGDLAQLPNVVTSDVKTKVDAVFNKYNIDSSYSYSENSFLSSVKKVITDLPTVMLEEHYRCHPKIINFCNKEFYNNKLVIMTKDSGEKDVIKVIRTVKGNHARGLFNQREVDEIKKIVKTPSDDIGIIAPYNDQVNLIKENIPNINASTIHKFQGRELDTIIISTVDNHVSDFEDKNMLNVAISRAKKHLYFITTGNEIHNNIVNDFINYVAYYSMDIENSKIYSCFDILYKQYESERLDYYRKHRKITEYDSENIIYYLLKDILKDYDGLDFHMHESLNDLIYDKSLLNKEEYKYISNPNTHLDFYIFKKIGNIPVLSIEVDGYKYHNDSTIQHKRDLLKNSVLEKYNIPLIRLKTNGSEEEKKIRDELNKHL